MLPVDIELMLIGNEYAMSEERAKKAAFTLYQTDRQKLAMLAERTGVSESAQVRVLIRREFRQVFGQAEQVRSEGRVVEAGQ